jgi:DNA-binding transcriptional ArsR family regulator/DNA-binding PadR family transcriptional regulator
MDETLPSQTSYTESMNTTYPIATVGELIGDPARATILMALLDGRTRAAGELAFVANISAQSASGHLSKLLDGGLLAVRSAGRHRYYRLAGGEVAHALEALGAIATRARPADAIRPRASRDLYMARTCYDHLAGRVAVELAGRLEKSGVIRAQGERNFELGPRGKRWFAKLGIDVDELRRSRRCFARQCIDWTERRPHIAGILGAALCSRLVALGWIARRRETRAVRITEQGVRELRTRFGLSLPANAGQAHGADRPEGRPLRRYTSESGAGSK